MYELRGWNIKSGLAGNSIHNESISVAFIGDFSDRDLSSNQLQVLEVLIETGRKRKLVTKDYKIYGLRKNFETEKMFQKLSKMEHWRGYINS